MFVESAYSGEQHVKQRALDEQFVETKTEGGKRGQVPQFSSSSAAPATVEAFPDTTRDGLAAKVGSGLLRTSIFRSKPNNACMPFSIAFP